MKSGELSKTGKMKNLKLLSLIIALCSVSLISCGGDDNNDEPIPENTTTEETSESNLPDEAKAFVGYWAPDGGRIYNDYCFFDDGTAFRRNWKNSSSEYKEFGYWTYDIDTKILATTFTASGAGNAIQYSITLSNENVWTGIAPSGTPIKFEKSIDKYFQYMLSNSSWTAADRSTISFGYYEHVWGGESTYYSLLSVRGTNIQEGYYLNILSCTDEYNMEYNLCYLNTSSWGNKYNSAGSGTLTIVNPYSPKKCKLVLTGTISKEYSYDVPQQ